MKTKAFYIVLLITFVLSTGRIFAQDEERSVPSFSEISLRIPGVLHLEQGPVQQVSIVAKSTTREEIITEVKDRKLIIRFAGKNYLMKSFNPGRIEVFVTVPEIDGLSVSGSGDIIVPDEIQTRILDLVVSGSGDIQIDHLKAERVKANISGSGDIIIGEGGIVSDLGVTISGSGNVKAEGLEATDVVVTIAGSGNCTITSNGSIKARIAGSGKVFYKGNPSIDSSVAGSGSVKKI